MGDGYKGKRMKDDSSNWATSWMRNQGRDPLIQVIKSDDPLETIKNLHIPGTDEAEQAWLRILDPDGGLAQRKMYMDGEWVDEADYDRIRDARAKQKFFEKMDQQRAQRQSGYNLGYGYASGGAVAPGKGGRGMGMGSMGGGYARPAVMPQQQRMGQPAVMPQRQDMNMERQAVLPQRDQMQRPAVMPGGGTISQLPAMKQGIGSLTGGPAPMPQQDIAYAGGSPNFNESAGSQTIQPMPTDNTAVGATPPQIPQMGAGFPGGPPIGSNWQQMLTAMQGQQGQQKPLPGSPGYSQMNPPSTAEQQQAAAMHGQNNLAQGQAYFNMGMQPSGMEGMARPMPANPSMGGKGGQPQQPPNMGNRNDFMRGRPMPSQGGPQPVGGGKGGGQSPAYGRRSRMGGAPANMGGKGGG